MESSTNTLFSEHEEVINCINFLTREEEQVLQVVSLPGTVITQVVNDGGNDGVVDKQKIITNAYDENKIRNNETLAKLRRIWDKYLECPTLLDPYLDEMVTNLAEYARRHLDNGNATNDENGDQTQEKQTFYSLESRLSYVLSALYALCKVCGRKRIQRFLPHEARDVEPVLRTLQFLHNKHNNDSKQQQTQHHLNNLTINTKSDATITHEEEEAKPWESVYVLWLWLGMLSLVPFQCTVLDSSSSSSTTTLVSSLVELAKENFTHAGPTRETAASCLSSWLSRPDLEMSELVQFVSWSNDVLSRFGAGEPATTTTSSHNDIFVVMGVLQTLTTIVKTNVNRKNVIQVMEQLWEQALVLSEQSTHQNMLLRKLLVKWFSRMGCAYLPPKLANWRYQRGRRSLLENLKASSSSPSCNKTKSGKLPNKQSVRVEEEDDDDSLFYVPDQVEDVMGQLLLALADPATVVRWSAAKGIGRVTERLPALCAHDILDAVLSLCKDEEKDHAWHGACLALAELARRGLLLPSRLEDVVPLVVRAVQYDVRRGPTSVGSNVRDAACYTYWAFARAYAPSILKPYIPELSKSIVVASLFDREVNCRRAASAAFQECVGRQGADNFKHGISILTAADYFSLGNRTDSFTSVAYHVAQFSEYQKPIFQHLYQVKLYHWDINIRILASKSLHRLAAYDPLFMSQTVVPYLLGHCTDKALFVRHGALWGLAEVLLALGAIHDEIHNESNEKTFSESIGLSNTSIAAIAETVTIIEKARLYRGRGGEIMRSAVCRFIECISIAKLPLSVRQQVRLLDTIDACLKHPSEDIQNSASNALYSLTRSYFPTGESGPSDRLQNRVVNKYVGIVKNEKNPAATRGFALALGSLPSKLLAPSKDVLNSIICCLCDTSRPDARVGGEADAETRRNAIISLSRVCKTVSTNNKIEKSKSVVMDQQQIIQVFEAFLLALQDYNTDRRGDVGSWSRIAAMTGLEDLTSIALKSTFDHKSVAIEKDGISTAFREKDNLGCLDSDVKHGFVFDKKLCVRVIGAFLKQMSEKLDAVRAHAGECLIRMLTQEDPSIPYIPNKPLLLESLCPDSEESQIFACWSNAEITFPMVMKIAGIDEFFPSILSGMLISVGGLTESVTKYASRALIEWAREPELENSSERRDTKLGRALLHTFQYHQKEARVILPLVKTIDILISHGCLDEIMSKSESEFVGPLFQLLKTEARNLSDIYRLFAIINVSISLLGTRHKEMVRCHILPFLLNMLVHRFPRIRRYTAEQLYMHLLEDGLIISTTENLDEVMNYLVEAPWEADIERSSLLKIREKIAHLIGVEIKEKLSKAPSKQELAPTDDFESYASLVSEVMR